MSTCCVPTIRAGSTLSARPRWSGSTSPARSPCRCRTRFAISCSAPGRAVDILPVSGAAMTKFVFVTGGVVSSLGKGIAAASMAALLESRGVKVTLLKLDPYINVDPGTMSPFQHGEVFVTEDGAETDLDLGHYERFSNAKMTKRNNF